MGGPAWESLPPDQQPERASLLPLRERFGLFCNLRPAIIFPALTGASSLKEEVIEGGFDLLVVRGVFRFTDLPESAREKLLFRKNLRSQWQAVPDPLGGEDGVL